MHERTVPPTGEEVEAEVATGIEARILGDVTWAEDRIDLIPTQGNHLNVTSAVHNTIALVPSMSKKRQVLLDSCCKLREYK